MNFHVKNYFFTFTTLCDSQFFLLSLAIISRRKLFYRKNSCFIFAHLCWLHSGQSCGVLMLDGEKTFLWLCLTTGKTWFLALLDQFLSIFFQYLFNSAISSRKFYGRFYFFITSASGRVCRWTQKLFERLKTNKHFFRFSRLNKIFFLFSRRSKPPSSF